MWYRPIKWKRITALTLDQMISGMEEYLFRFTKTRSYDSGIRLSGAEAYLQGLIDARTAIRREARAKIKYEITTKK